MTEAFVHDLAICGAGPGGLAAARSLAGLGASVVLVDEQNRAGGQFLRQPPAAFTVANWLPSGLYAAGKNLLHATAMQPDLSWNFDTTIHGLFHDRDAGGEPVYRLWASTLDGPVDIRARNVLIATGCYDMPVAFPGWTLPGVMSAGGIQTFIKSQQILPGRRFVLSGSHPLQLVLADQILNAGGTIAAICLPQSRSAVFEVLKYPAVLAANSGKFFSIAKILLRLLRAGVPVRFNAAVTHAFGGEALEAVAISTLDANGRPVSGSAERLDCDTLGICYGFLASSELARQAGAAATWDAGRGGWLVSVDDWQQTSEAGLFAAGEITAVEGSDAAMAEGEIAAFAIARRLGLMTEGEAEQRAEQSRQRLAQHRRFAEALTSLSQPPAGLIPALRQDDTLICRCEDLTAGDLRTALADNAFVRTPNALKLLTRIGMGPCQGRMCGHAVIDLMRESGVLTASETPTGFTPRAPVKPFYLSGVKPASNA